MPHNGQNPPDGPNASVAPPAPLQLQLPVPQAVRQAAAAKDVVRLADIETKFATDLTEALARAYAELNKLVQGFPFKGGGESKTSSVNPTPGK